MRHARVITSPAAANPSTSPTNRYGTPRVVVVGGGVAGLTAAFELRRRLGDRATVTVIARGARFVLGMALPWIPFGLSPRQMSFALAPALEQQGIHFIDAVVERIAPERRLLRIADQDVLYDYLLIATGPSAGGLALTGFSDHLSATSDRWTAEGAAAARRELERFLERPGPVVVGAAQDAGYLQGAYEFALHLDAALRRRGTREQASITFVTPEPYLGKLHTDVPAARRLLERLFSQRGITALTETVVEGVEQGTVRLRNKHSRGSRTLPATYTAVIPPVSGVAAVWTSPGLANARGLVPIDRQYRHTQFPEIYAAGDAVHAGSFALPGSMALPRTGYLATAMAKAAARNIAAAIGGKPSTARSLPHLLDIRLLDGGDVGVLLVTVHLYRPLRLALPLPGRSAHVAKRLLARYVVWKLRTGRTYLP